MFVKNTRDLFDCYWIFGRLNRIENNGMTKVICFLCMKGCKELQDSSFYNLSEKEGRINYINFVKAVLSRDKQYIPIHFPSSSRNLHFLTLNFRRDCLSYERSQKFSSYILFFLLKCIFLINLLHNRSKKNSKFNF